MNHLTQEEPAALRKDAVIGINPDTRIVNTIATMDAGNVMEMLRAGEVVVPVTREQCRELWGQKVSDALQLAIQNGPSVDPAAVLAAAGVVA